MSLPNKRFLGVDPSKEYDNGSFIEFTEPLNQLIGVSFLSKGQLNTFIPRRCNAVFLITQDQQYLDTSSLYQN